jgi:hypothetical protein
MSKPVGIPVQSRCLRITLRNKADGRAVHEYVFVGFSASTINQMFREWDNPTRVFDLTAEEYHVEPSDTIIDQADSLGLVEIGTCVLTRARESEAPVSLPDADGSRALKARQPEASEGHEGH